ncbi:MAG: 4Fe-4S ferredoxin [Candidatus Adiutrix sp.]|nr:4Fe-4S ferredoxin [Candidatus Adiutrix sp.]
MNSAKVGNNTKVRDIIEIDESLCNGCGQCLINCAEGALALVDGKARLVSDIYCDGLGACLGHCPTGALKVIQRSAPDFDEEAAMSRVREMQSAAGGEACGCSGHGAAPAAKSGGCPGAKARQVEPVGAAGLSSWPIQLKLVSPAMQGLDSPVLVLAADCTAFTGVEFHRVFLGSGYPLVMGCPKLDEVEPYIEKVAAILKAHPRIQELRVPMMSVPCCGGLGYIAAQAMKRSGRESEIALRTWIVTPQGQVTEEAIR